MLEVDFIWPSILAEDLVDLTPYLRDDLGSYSPALLQAFTVNGRLVALPNYLDTALLYYRADLLKKYGFSGPPRTWNELEDMAKVIQRGERRAGNKDFWGYVWQGEASEALTCNAIEWFSSAGGGHLLEQDRTVRVGNRAATSALERAVSWVGTISPPGVTAYNENDSFNVWRSGKAVFMRNWNFVYRLVLQSPSPVRDRFGVALLPGGPAGSWRTLGPSAVAVSRYSEHREQAIAALRELTSESAQRASAQATGRIPTRWSLQQRAEVMANTPFHGALTGQVMKNVISRPSVLAGKSYDSVSRASFEAVHSALTHQSSPADALARLERQLVKITGFQARRD